MFSFIYVFIYLYIVILELDPVIDFIILRKTVQDIDIDGDQKTKIS